MMRANAGDIVRVKIQAGAHEHEHNATIHGVKWLQAGSGFGKAPNSGWRNAQNDGISTQFSFRVPIIQVANQRGNQADFAYSVDSSQDGWWSGIWGLMRTYDGGMGLFDMPNSVNRFRIGNANEFSGVCPRTAPVRSYDVTAVMVNDVFPNEFGVTIVPNDSSVTMNAAYQNGARLDPNGGTLVYNPRPTALDNGKSGPLHDPTAMVYVQTADLEAKDPTDSRCILRGKGKPRVDPTLPECPVKAKAGVTPQPLTLRAAAGDCIEVTVRNRLPDGLNGPGAPDLAGYNTLLQVVNRDRFDPQGVTTFQNNLIQPSSYVGIRPQLVAYDVTRADGARVGRNPARPVDPGMADTFRWYAGDIDFTVDGDGVNLVATPIEFGAAGLIPADKVKQGQKAMVGALIIEPEGSSWVEDAGDPEGATVTRSDGTTFRDYAVVLQKGLNHRFGDGTAVENIASEGQGIPEDSHDAGQMAVNYGTEPAWFRYGFRPDAPFGQAAGGGLADVDNAHELYSNTLAGVGGDPATPVIPANAGQETRLRVVLPTGAGRGTTFNVHGHGWQRDPYVCSTPTGICGPTDLASQALGDNPIGMRLGHQESLTPAAHFDFLLPSAGGSNAIAGDYLFRDQGSFGNTSGIWGILRVAPADTGGGNGGGKGGGKPPK